MIKLMLQLKFQKNYYISSCAHEIISDIIYEDLKLVDWSSVKNWLGTNLLYYVLVGCAQKRLHVKPTSVQKIESWSWLHFLNWGKLTRSRKIVIVTWREWNPETFPCRIRSRVIGRILLLFFWIFLNGITFLSQTNHTIEFYGKSCTRKCKND